VLHFLIEGTRGGFARMVAKPLLPQAFWFRPAFSCPRVDKMPSSGAAGSLVELPESCSIPSLQQLDQPAAWASVRAGWNAEGIGLVVLAAGVPAAQLNHRPEGFATVRFWLDTRDTRGVSRATRFCHHFVAKMESRRTLGPLKVHVERREIARSLDDPPPCRLDVIAARAAVTSAGWRLELFLPVQVLNGFDPETNRRLGFAYQITDYVRDDQFLSVGRDFPIGENPSLWATLELLD
jgi:hypothetical protein